VFNESSEQDCDLQHHLILVFVLFIVGATFRARNNPFTVEALQNKIRNVTASITAAELQCVSQGLL
jgi:hypothetical protein